MVKFTETKTEDLIKRIENLKAERERTADCLERLEAELERRKKFPLGAPIGGAISRSFLLWFPSKESADKFDNEYFANFIKALQDIAEGKPIDIESLLPLLRKGWVAMDEDKRWYWFKHKPTRTNTVWTTAEDEGLFRLSGAFNLKPADDWRESLMECGL